VLDTVVLLRALINPRSPAGRLVFDLTDRYDAVLSPPIIREMLEVVSRSSLRRKFPRLAEMNIEAMLRILAHADVVEPVEVPPVSRDPADDKFFACAVAGAADCIVSEDKDILAVGEYRGIRTINTIEFIALLRQ
jgi:putative PIN family toxin of toxin-antitoxin system